MKTSIIKEISNDSEFKKNNQVNDNSFGLISKKNKITEMFKYLDSQIYYHVTCAEIKKITKDICV